MTFTVKLANTQVNPGDYTKIVESNPPVTSATADAIQNGTVTVSQLARGSIANTSIALSNADIFHICDPKSEVAFFLASKSSEIAQLIQQARDTLITALFGDAQNPLITQIKGLIKDAIAVLKRVNKVLKSINNAIQTAQAVIADINAFIDIVKTLPQRIAQTLQQCLVLLQNTLANATTIGLGDVGTLIQQTQLAINQTTQAVNGVNSLGNNLNSLVANISTVPSALATNTKAAVNSVTNSVQNFASGVTSIQTIVKVLL